MNEKKETRIKIYNFLRIDSKVLLMETVEKRGDVFVNGILNVFRSASGIYQAMSSKLVKMTNA